MMSSSNDSGDEVESTDSAKSFRKTKLIFYLVNMLFFGVSVLLFVVGISYLTIYRYDYSLTIFSTTLIAGIFIAFSVVLFVLSFLNVIFIQTSRRRALSASLGGVLLVLVVLLAFGIWGLATSSNRDYLNDEVRLDLMQTFQQYNERRTDKFETMKIDWVQTKFNCCGVDSYADWRAFFLYGGQYKPINYVDQWSVNNNLPYVDNVPDSCCSVPSPNCGKYHRQQQPSIYASEVINFNYQFGGRDNQMLIYTKVSHKCAFIRIHRIVII